MPKQQEKSPEQLSSDNWHWALFYYAPKDSRVFVPKRRGYGWTLNFARPGAYPFLLAPFAIGLIIVLSVWLFHR